MDRFVGEGIGHRFAFQQTQTLSDYVRHRVAPAASDFLGIMHRCWSTQPYGKRAREYVLADLLRVFRDVQRSAAGVTDALITPLPLSVRVAETCFLLRIPPPTQSYETTNIYLQTWAHPMWAYLHTLSVAITLMAPSADRRRLLEALAANLPALSELIPCHDCRRHYRINRRSLQDLVVPIIVSDDAVTPLFNFHNRVTTDHVAAHGKPMAMETFLDEHALSIVTSTPYEFDMMVPRMIAAPTPPPSPHNERRRLSPTPPSAMMVSRRDGIVPALLQAAQTSLHYDLLASMFVWLLQYVYGDTETSRSGMLQAQEAREWLMRHQATASGQEVASYFGLPPTSAVPAGTSVSDGIWQTFAYALEHGAPHHHWQLRNEYIMEQLWSVPKLWPNTHGALSHADWDTFMTNMLTCTPDPEYYRRVLQDIRTAMDAADLSRRRAHADSHNP